MKRRIAPLSVGLLTAIGIIACASGCMEVANDRHGKLRRDQWVAEQKEALRTSKQSSIHFYSTSKTDELVSEFAGMPEIKCLIFNLADLSDAGMQTVGQFPNLAKLTLYGGNPGIGNSGLQSLAEKQSIVKLDLINTQVTNDGLSVLASLPALTELTLYREAWRQPSTLTDGAVAHLTTLKLKKLRTGGDWLSEPALEELKRSLPTCEIDPHFEADLFELCH